MNGTVLLMETPTMAGSYRKLSKAHNYLIKLNHLLDTFYANLYYYVKYIQQVKEGPPMMVGFIASHGSTLYQNGALFGN